MTKLFAGAAFALLLSACATAPMEPPATTTVAEIASPAPAMPAPSAAAALDLSPAAVKARDPFLWLEEVQGERALAWVREQNARADAVLKADRRYEPFRQQALEILTATDRIAQPSFRAGGIDNFWQDKTNVRGLWRRAGFDSYRSPSPKWETVLDIDALAKAEGRGWIFKGDSCLKPEERLCLVSLSDGGKDAVVVREYDATARRFVSGGFSLPEGKHRLDWVDRDTLVVATEWAPGELTESGYPFVVKLVKRGQPFAAAKEIYRGSKDDGGYGVLPEALHDDDGALRGILVVRPVNTFDAEHWLAADGRPPQKLNLPLKASYQTFVDGQVLFTLEEAWNGLPQGALVSYDLESLRRGSAPAPQLVLAPKANQAIAAVDSTENLLLVNLYEDVKGAIDVYDYRGGAWARTRRLDLPKDASVGIRSASGKDDRLFANVQGFLEPTTLYFADAATGRVEKVKASPARFDAALAVGEQFWATSKDGTRIPYFVVRPKQTRAGGAPTLLFGYGGFQVSKPPVYIPEMGKLWLENGGVFVNANIRGGGEFGPAWHQSVLREKRQGVFDDFTAVAEDLVRRGITTPDRLGVYGRSNGGVLTSVAITQRPELFDAAVIESPLVDMLRYHDLPAGASWIGEYGDPRVAADAEFIARYSAYQNLKPGTKYPEAYITTNTKDDRVHPGHARKFAAALQAAGAPVIYYENTEGGHSNDSDPLLNAERWARHYVYLSRRLMD